MDLWGLHKSMVAQFDSDELEMLALGVGMNRGQFSSERVDVRATDLIVFAQREGKLETLAKCCVDVRANIDWVAFVKSSPAPLPPANLPSANPMPPDVNANAPQIPPIIGMWQVTNPMGQMVGWMRINPDYTFQFSGGWGQASGRWWWNTSMNAFQSQGAFMNGMVYSPAFSIQQWVPNGFIALGGDGILYMHVRAG